MTDSPEIDDLSLPISDPDAQFTLAVMRRDPVQTARERYAMTDDELDRLDKLAAAANPGPWDNTYFYVMAGVFRKPNDVGVPVGRCTYCRDDDQGYEPVKLLKTYHVHRKPHGTWNPDGWHHIHNAKGVTIAGAYDYDDGGIIYEPDAKLIAASRTAIPELISEIRRLRAGIRDALGDYDHGDELSCVQTLRRLVREDDGAF